MLLVHPSRNITLWGKRRSLAELRGCWRTWSNARQKMLKSGGNKMDLGTLTRSKMGREVEDLTRQAMVFKVVLRKMMVCLPHLLLLRLVALGGRPAVVLTLLLLRLVVLSTPMDQCLRPCWVQIAMVVVLPKAVWRIAYRMWILKSKKFGL